jgi:hypothetical protein
LSVSAIEELKGSKKVPPKNNKNITNKNFFAIIYSNSLNIII